MTQLQHGLLRYGIEKVTNLKHMKDLPENFDSKKQGCFRVIDYQVGDLKIVWDRTKKIELEEAEETFKRMRSKGYMAYTVDKKGKKGTVIHKFDPDAERIIFAPPMAGG